MPDRSEFDDFVVMRSRALLRTSYLLTRDWSTAEDLLQVSLTKAWRVWSAECDVLVTLRARMVTRTSHSASQRW